MSWRDVPMPTAVAKLPRDKRGFPVPWVSEWHPDDARIGYLRWGHPNGVTVETAFADCECEIGVGEPNLGALCTKRQIKGMLERLCDVCGEFIPAGPVYFIGGAFIGMDGATGFRECGLHYECALYSARVCPGITTKGDKPSIHVANAYALQPEFLRQDKSTPDGTSKIIFESFQDPALQLVSRMGRVVLMCIYAVPINPTITPVPEWVERQLAKGAA